jgi:hypothetical protein
MISNCTIKFGPAVSQKEVAKKFAEGKSLDGEELSKLHQMKARVEVFCDFADLKKIDDLLEELSKESG